MGTYAIPWVCLIPVSNLASEERNGKVYPALFCLNWLIFAQKCKNTRESSERQLEVDSHLVDVGSSEELLQIPVRDVRAIQAWATGAREMNLLLHDRKVIVTGYLWCENRQRQPVSHQCPTMYPNNYWEPACYSKETKKNNNLQKWLLQPTYKENTATAAQPPDQQRCHKTVESFNHPKIGPACLLVFAPTSILWERAVLCYINNNHGDIPRLSLVISTMACQDLLTPEAACQISSPPSKMSQCLCLPLSKPHCRNVWVFDTSKLHHAQMDLKLRKVFVSLLCSVVLRRQIGLLVEFFIEKKSFQTTVYGCVLLLALLHYLKTPLLIKVVAPGKQSVSNIPYEKVVNTNLPDRLTYILPLSAFVGKFAFKHLGQNKICFQSVLFILRAHTVLYMQITSLKCYFVSSMCL